MNQNTIKLDDAPVWDFYIEIRGANLPLVSPHDATDIPESPLPAQAKIDSMNERWPGIFVWAWRMITGSPRLSEADLPKDGGAEYTRTVCKVILGQEHSELVDSLGSGECSQLVAMYMGLQEKWLIAANQYAMDIASKSLKAEKQAPEGMAKLVPGGPLPAILKPERNPMVHDDRTGGVA